MRRLKPILLGGLIAAPISLFGTSSAFGAISLIDQSRFIEISGSAPQVPINATVPTPFNQSATASPSSPFNQSLTNTISEDGLIVYDTSAANQTSTLNANSQGLELIASGGASYSTGEFGQGYIGSVYYAVFSVDTPTPYSLTEQIGYVDTTPDIDLLNDGVQLVSGQLSTPTGVPYPDNSASLVPPLLAKFGGTSTVGPETFTGTLSPGTYTMEGGVGGPASSDDDGNGTFSLDLVVGTAPVSVPLPGAVWMGLATMGLAAGAIWTYRRRLALR